MEIVIVFKIIISKYAPREQIRKSLTQLIFIFIFFPYNLLAQEHSIDSLKSRLSDNLPDTLRYEALWNINWKYLTINDDSALKYGQQLVQFVAREKAKLPFWAEWNGNQAIGMALMLLGNHPDAQEAFFKQLKQCEVLKDTFGIFEAYRHLGELNKYQENHKMTILYYKKCIEIYNIQKYSDWAWDVMHAMKDLADTYGEIDILDSALYYAQQSLQLSIKTYGTGSSHNTDHILGVIYSKMGQPSLAMDYFRSFLQNFAKIDDPERSYCFYLMAEHFVRNRQADSALFYANKAIRIDQNYNNKIAILKTSLLLSKLYQSQKNIDSAFKYQSIMIETQDYLFSKEKVSRMETLEFNEQLRQRELESEKIKAEEERKQNIQYALIAIGIISIIVLFLFLGRSFITNTRLISFLGIIALLLVFEFLDLLLHPFLGRITHHTPYLMLLAMVCIAATLAPIHHRMEKWATIKMVEKNRATRLANAKKTIEKLESNPIQPIDENTT